MNDIVQKNKQKDINNGQIMTDKKSDFFSIYNKSNKLSAAVFLVSDLIDNSDDLKTKIKRLSLDLVSLSINLKDTNYFDAQKTFGEIEKKTLEMMSLLDIASIAGLISKMNAEILKEEFNSFLIELNNFFISLNSGTSLSIKNIFKDDKKFITNDNKDYFVTKDNHDLNIEEGTKKIVEYRSNLNSTVVLENKSTVSNNKTHKRKDVRKETIFDFIKGHGEVSIKDIVPNIIGCSEKTVQRELMVLIKEGKIKKEGERRWSKYSVI